MRFTINRENFLKALNTASKAISSKSPIPVMTNFKLSLYDDVLSVLASNNEISIKTDIPSLIEDKRIINDSEEGSTLVASKYLTEIVRKIEGEVISFEVIDETIAQISDLRSNFKLNSIRPEEYPDIDLHGNGTSFVLTVDQFKTIVDQTAFAASTKEQRPILTAGKSISLRAKRALSVAVATNLLSEPCKLTAVKIGRCSLLDAAKAV